MITVALIDDHLIVRSGFAQLLGLEPDLQVVAEFGSGREALAGLPGRGVQVCICDISMPDISGLELLSQLPKGMATIMLSVHDSPALVEQAGHAAFFPNAVARMNSLLRCIRLPRAAVI
ncbi:TPA: response regulator [Escherichia coli]|nr:response regulator [Escherichia coli]